MQKKYSDELIKRFREYAKENWNKDLTEDQCDEYLDRLGGLFSAMASGTEKKGKKTEK